MKRLPVSISKVSGKPLKLTGIGRNYISQAVNLCKGKNFNSFINEYRIKEAVHLLATLDKTKYPIEEIGVMSGFNDHKELKRYC